jgi:hypothetical protein
MSWRPKSKRPPSPWRTWRRAMPSSPARTHSLGSARRGTTGRASLYAAGRVLGSLFLAFPVSDTDVVRCRHRRSLPPDASWALFSWPSPSPTPTSCAAVTAEACGEAVVRDAGARGGVVETIEVSELVRRRTRLGLSFPGLPRLRHRRRAPPPPPKSAVKLLYVTLEHAVESWRRLR